MPQPRSLQEQLPSAAPCTDFGKRSSSVEVEGQPTQHPTSPSTGGDAGSSYQARPRTEQQDSGQPPGTPPRLSLAFQQVEERRLKSTSEGGTDGMDKVTCTCCINIEGREAEVLVDTGSSVTLVRQSVIDQANISETRPPSSRLKSATGHEIPVAYEAKL